MVGQKFASIVEEQHSSFSSSYSVMAHTHCTRPGQGQGPGNNGFLYYATHCTHYTGTGTWNHCFFIVCIPFLVHVPVSCSVYEP